MQPILTHDPTCLFCLLDLYFYYLVISDVEIQISVYACTIEVSSFVFLIVCSNSRYFNVIGSDPEGRLGEAPRPELREHGRISGACFDAARGITDGLKVNFFWSHLVFDVVQ